MQPDAFTSILDQAGGGQPGSFTRLVELVYDDMKRIADKRLARAFPSHSGALTLQGTAIVNDVLLEMREQFESLTDRGHFFAIATLLIRRRINDYRKARNARKRGGGKRGVGLHDTEGNLRPIAANPPQDHSDVWDAIEALHKQEPRQAEIVSLHVICGY